MSSKEKQNEYVDNLFKDFSKINNIDLTKININFEPNLEENLNFNKQNQIEHFLELYVNIFYFN